MAETLATNLRLERDIENGSRELGWNRFLGTTVSALADLPPDFFYVIKE